VETPDFFVLKARRRAGRVVDRKLPIDLLPTALKLEIQAVIIKLSRPRKAGSTLTHVRLKDITGHCDECMHCYMSHIVMHEKLILVVVFKISYVPLYFN
jgi:hypothetical protein